LRGSCLIDWSKTLLVEVEGMRRSILLVTFLLVFLAVLGYVLQEALARPWYRPGPCLTVEQRRVVESVFDRHRQSLRAAQNRLADELYALRRLLLSGTATRQQVDAQSSRVAEARNALEKARLDFLWDVRQALPPDQRERVLRCIAGGALRFFRW